MKRTEGLWRAPRIWPDGDCFILGGGPSLAGVDIDLLRGRRVIAINCAYKLGDWFDALFFADCRWLHSHGKGLLDWAGLKVTTCPQHINKPGIKVMKKRNSPHGLTTDPSLLGWNLSSGACAINLAVHFGVRRIVLLGYDMKKTDGRCNWHEDYGVNPKKNPYDRFRQPFVAIAADLDKMKVECLNASPDSALEVFKRVRLEDVL